MASDNAGSSNQSATGAKDDSGQAFESGEPKLIGRSHGQAIDDQGAPADRDEVKSQKNRPSHNDNTSGQSGKTSQATESGRQRATL